MADSTCEAVCEWLILLICQLVAAAELVPAA